MTASYVKAKNLFPCIGQLESEASVQIQLLNLKDTELAAAKEEVLSK